jgi:hypothetical protein
MESASIVPSESRDLEEKELICNGQYIKRHSLFWADKKDKEIDSQEIHFTSI